MVSRLEQDLTRMVAASVQVTSYNKGGEMPYRLVCGENDKVLWVCGPDEQGRIVSVFQFQGSTDELAEKRCSYLPSKDKAAEVRQTLLDEGWIEAGLPDMRIQYPGMEPLTVGDVQLNRRQKRNYSKTMDTVSNPHSQGNRAAETKNRLRSKLEARKAHG